jgi:hypothetical protein
MNHRHAATTYKEHKPEALVREVEGGQHVVLPIKVVTDVHHLKEVRHQHWEGHKTVLLVLCQEHDEVDSSPPDHTWPPLHVELDVKVSVHQTRVGLNPHPKINEEVASRVK